MLGQEQHIADITHQIQLSIAPVFLLTAIGTLINALAGRLSRAVDRRRLLEELVGGLEGEGREQAIDELANLGHRVQLVLWSMALAVMSGLFVCLLIGTAFMGAFISLDLSRPVAVLFVAAVIALSLTLVLFMREVFLAARTVRYMRVVPERVERT
ncbi:MAG: DUF2721 domain-containing protein [Bacillota bacterium]